MAASLPARRLARYRSVCPRRPPIDIDIDIDIDIEASGFGAGGEMIEIGVVMEDGRGCCSRMQRRGGGRRRDARADRARGIRHKPLLIHGRRLLKVAGRLNELLRRRTAYSDDCMVDRLGLVQLCAAASMRYGRTFIPVEIILSESRIAAWAETNRLLLAEKPNPRHLV